MKKRFLVMFSLALAVILLLCSCGSAVIKIDSPVGDLEYPAQWKQYLKTESDGTSVTFYAELKGKSPLHLFTLYFGTEKGYHLGEKDGTAISIVDGQLNFDATWSEEEKKIVSAMSADVNVILDKLGLLEISEVSEASIEVDLTYFASPIGDLACRKELADQMSCASEDDILSFYGKTDDGREILLFQFGFNKPLEYEVGAVDHTEISFGVNDLAAENLTEDEASKIEALQDAVNDLLQSISEVEGFSWD